MVLSCIFFMLLIYIYKKENKKYIGEKPSDFNMVKLSGRTRYSGIGEIKLVDVLINNF